MEQTTKICNNCKEETPESTHAIHELGCKKYCTYCEDCTETIPKEDWDDHIKDCHVPVACPDCGKLVSPNELTQHKESCPEGYATCKFCELDIKQSNYLTHVDGCGSRTDQCDNCGVRVTLSEMQEHVQLKCGHLKAEPPLSLHTLASLSGDPYSIDTMTPDRFTDDSTLAARLQREENERDRAFEIDFNFARQLQEQQYHHPAHDEYSATSDLSTDHNSSLSAGTISHQLISSATSNSTRGTAIGHYDGANASLPAHSALTYHDVPISNQYDHDHPVDRDSVLAASIQQQEVDRDKAYEVDFNLARQLQKQEQQNPGPSYSGNYHVREDEDFNDTFEEPVLKKSQRQVVPDDLLPCQFCDGFFPAQKLTLHENSCLPMNSSSLSVTSNGTKACSYCGEHVSVSTCSVHETFCKRNPSINEAKEPKELCIPCENCGELFSLNNIHRHQVSCTLTRQ